MAINKNFVIKNGVQVSTDLIIGDTDTNKVGIGTTVPHYDLHVGVARGSRGGIGVTDAVVAGVATINQLSVTGISTFAGALDVNSTVDFAGDVVFNGTNDITYDQSESALVFNDGAAIRVGTGSDFSIMHDGNNTILRERGTGALKILSNSVELLGATAGETLAKFNENGNVELYHDNTKHFEVVAIGATVFGDLTISGVTTSKELNVSSGSTFGGLVDANAGAHIDNLRLGIDADNDITTSSGNLTLDSAGGTVEVNDNLQVDGQTDLNGDINLGDATSETVTVTARFDSDLIPSSDNARDLGSSSLQWKDLHLNGTANLDILDVDGTSNFADDVVFAGAAANITFDQSTDDLIFEDNAKAIFGGSGTTTDGLELYHDGSNSFIQENGTGDLNLAMGSASKIVVQSGANGNHIAEFAYEGAAKLFFNGSEKIETTSGGLNVSGITTISDRLQVTSGISTFYDTTQSTSATTGAVIINGGVGIAKNVNIGGNLTVTGTTTFNGGTLTLGDANTDNIVFGGEVDSNIIPDDDNTHDLGSSSQQWKDIYVNGVGYIDSISADTAAISDLTDNRVVIAGSSGELEDDANFTYDGSKLGIGAGTGATVFNNGNAAFSGIVTANGGLSVGTNGSAGVAVSAHTNGNFSVSGIATFGGAIDANGGANIAGGLVANSAQVSDLTDNRVVIAGSSGELEDSGNLTFDGSTLAITGSIDLSADIDVDGTANLDVLDVDGDTNFGADVVFAGDAANITFDKSTDDFVFNDNAGAVFGTGLDLKISHDGTDSTILNTTNDLNITCTGDDINITSADDITIKVQGSEDAIVANGNGDVQLYHNANLRISTTDDGADIGGSGALKVPSGNTSERSNPAAAGDFRYNTETEQFEGYTTEWGAIAGSGGGGTTTSTSVSTTSATSTGSFAKASFRSASIIAQITQGSAYQVGRYLLIHDGTTVTTLEESAVATGSMLGTFEGVINGDNVEFRVTMGSSSSATVITNITTIAV